MSQYLSPDDTVKKLFLSACVFGKYELVRVLLANGAHVNWKEDVTLMSGLHKAAGNRQGHVVDLLLAQPGVDVNSKNQAGDTPLAYCLKNGRIQMARILLNNPRVDIDTKNEEGKYPENIAR